MPQAYEISPKLGHDAKLRLSTHSSKFLGYSAPYCDEPLYFETIEDAAKCVSDIVGHPIEPNVEAIDAALDDYLEVHEDDDTWYSFHEFIEDREG